MTSALNLLLWQLFPYFDLNLWQFPGNFESLNRTKSSSLKEEMKSSAPSGWSCLMPRQSFQGRAILGEQTLWSANSKSLLILGVLGTLDHPHQRPHDALSFQQWVKRKLIMSPCERQWEKTWQLHLLSWSHLPEGVLMLSLHSCLKIKEWLDGKQLSEISPLEIFSTKYLLKLFMLIPQVDKKCYIRTGQFCTLSILRYILGLYWCLFL